MVLDTHNKLNKGYLTASRTDESNENYTPYYAVEPILKYLKPNSTIWCPFDDDWSAFAVRLNEDGHNVINTSINNGCDFFDTNPINLGEIDYIISNPPFTIKDKILARLYNLDIPFAMLLPIPSLQSKERTKLFLEYGLELLVFDKRLKFHNINSWDKYISGTAFATGYFCHNILPEKLIFEIISEYNKKLK